MTSDDVVASLKRWSSSRSTAGPRRGTADLRAVDKYTVELKLKERTRRSPSTWRSPTTSARSTRRRSPRSSPAEATEFIGTGPTSWPSGSRTSTSGWSASTTTSREREATATAAPRPPGSTRSLDSGARRRHARGPDGDRGARLRRRPQRRRLRPAAEERERAAGRRQAYYWLVAVLNKKEGLMTNQKLRQAWQAASTSSRS